MSAGAPVARPGFASAQDVARLAGVSRSAVSRCFTPGASIAPETRARVLEAAQALGYQVNDLARGLIARQSRLVGLVVKGAEIGFRAHLAVELSRALIARGSIPMLIEIGRSATELDAARTILFGHRAEATVILSGSPPAEFVERARLNGQPLIVIGRDEPGCDAVHIGNGQAAMQAARLFYDRGLRQVGLIGSQTATPSAIEREAAFLAETARLGLRVLHHRGVDSVHAGGFDAMTQMLDRDPTLGAVFCINDPMAMGATDAARGWGLGVPGAPMIIGFDDLPEAAWPAFDLTTFRQDPAEVAHAAIRLINRRQTTPDAAPMTIELTAPLIERGSTRAVAAPVPRSER